MHRVNYTVCLMQVTPPKSGKPDEPVTFNVEGSSVTITFEPEDTNIPVEVGPIAIKVCKGKFLLQLSCL